uniref:Ethylene-insensitive protein 2 n=1 Tax=Kalanchoe fedtschenkoi TaxID=63787 RepID=A0A7N0R9F6_KALFE
MEAEPSQPNYTTSTVSRLLPAAVPVLLVSAGYIDPGKWAASIDAGTRFGFDLMLPMMIFSFASILCHYLSARIGVVTGRDLSQICRAEYDRVTCVILGVQAELSAIALDITVVMGIAHCLSHILGVELVTSLFLTALDVAAFPLFLTLVEKHTGKISIIYMAGFVFVCYCIGALVSQPDIPLSLDWMSPKLSGESVFALMSLLGACIMPHNFYLHSALVQQHQGQQNAAKSVLCQDHFSAVLCIFSCIFLVNLALMNSAANVFYSSGFVLLNFHDALSLMDQVFRSPIAPFALTTLLVFSNHINKSSWTISGQPVVQHFFGADIPIWLHRAVIRATAIILVIFCVWNSGAEGLYQLLIFVQVMVAVMLPSSLIPLFRVASSGQIMGAYKNPQLEFLSLSTFVGVLGAKVMFMVEMLFGGSDWVNSLRWSMGTNTSIPYAVLLATSIVSLAFMLWLAATPLKSASVRLDSQSLNWETRQMATPTLQREDLFNTASRRHFDETKQKEEILTAQGNSLDRSSERFDPSFDVSLPETLDSEPDFGLATVPEKSDVTHPMLPTGFLEVSPSTVESLPHLPEVIMEDDQKLVDVESLKSESEEVQIERAVRYEKEVQIEKAVRYENEVQIEKEDDGDMWEPEEPSKGIPAGKLTVANPPATSEGPGSFRSLGGKNEDGGSGIGSLSRLAGLGRAARRQFAVILDEFWEQMYDYHGQPTQEAKARRLDLLFGSELKSSNSMPKVDPVKEHTGLHQPAGGRGSGSLSTVYDSPRQQRVPSSFESSYGIQKASSMELSYGNQKGASSLWSNSNNMPLLDTYVQASGRNALDADEKRYSSLRAPPSSDMWDHHQPATVHGYQISQYLNQFSKDRGFDYSMDSSAASSNLGPISYRDYSAFGLSQKPQNGLNPVQASLLHNLAISRNTSMQSERSGFDMYSSGPGEVGGPVTSKKYNSMPDISGLAAVQRDLYMNSRNSFGNNSIGMGQSFGRVSYDQSSFSTAGLRTSAPLAFDELSPKVHRDPFAVHYGTGSGTGSLWSRQPFEQFGVADKNHSQGSDGSRNPAASLEVSYIVDFEAKLLQSLRHCVVKMLKLEGSDWLFKHNDGVDEDLIERVAAREKFLCEAENRIGGDSQQTSPDRKSGQPLKMEEPNFAKLISSVPNCGEGCVWKADLLVSFGVWCIHRILDLSLMESRPELWGKYTYVLNRLQGVIDLAFSKPRVPASPCFCLQVPETNRPKSSSPVTNGMLPPASKPGRGKCTTAPMVMDMIKDVEIAISCRKGRSGTAAGDVAFPKGKENLASVLKRYKRRLANKPAKTSTQGPGL